MATLPSRTDVWQSFTDAAGIYFRNKRTGESRELRHWDDLAPACSGAAAAAAALIHSRDNVVSTASFVVDSLLPRAACINKSWARAVRAEPRRDPRNVEVVGGGTLGQAEDARQVDTVTTICHASTGRFFRCPMMTCSVGRCQRRICGTHGNGAGRYNEDYYGEFEFETLSCQHPEGCSRAYCEQHFRNSLRPWETVLQPCTRCEAIISANGEMHGVSTFFTKHYCTSHLTKHTCGESSDDESCNSDEEIRVVDLCRNCVVEQRRRARVRRCIDRM